MDTHLRTNGTVRETTKGRPEPKSRKLLKVYQSHQNLRTNKQVVDSWTSSLRNDYLSVSKSRWQLFDHTVKIRKLIEMEKDLSKSVELRKSTISSVLKFKEDLRSDELLKQFYSRKRHEKTFFQARNVSSLKNIKRV